MSDRPHKQVSTKADPGSGVLVISLLKELWMGDVNCSLPLICGGLCWQIWLYILSQTIDEYLPVCNNDIVYQDFQVVFKYLCYNNHDNLHSKPY